MRGRLSILQRLLSASFSTNQLVVSPCASIRTAAIYTSAALFNHIRNGFLRPYSQLSDGIVYSSVPSAPRKRIAVGVSGGVDSAVAALLLKKAGHDVVGVFMRNWDEAEETGNRNCSIERDLKDAAAVCRQLGIPLHEADFVSQYWNQVFTSFLLECSRGLTPNPDLACNRHIKFGALLEFAKSMGADTVATGHYARLRTAPDGAVQLLKGVDQTKDQSYFLASVHADSLRNVMFPLGDHKKSDVRQIAAAAGLVPADKRSSAGICFIGRRNFAEFLGQYIPPKSGTYVDVETGKELGPCADVNTVTYGQRPGIGGASDRTYVAGKDINTGAVYIATGRNHPALVTRSACLREPHWLSAEHAEHLQRHGELRCEYKARYGQETTPCTLTLLRSEDESAALFHPSVYCGLHPSDAKIKPGYLLVEFSEPAGSITPQQMFVMYDGEVCIGSAAIAMPGRTVYEEENQELSLGAVGEIVNSTTSAGVFSRTRR